MNKLISAAFAGMLAAAGSAETLVVEKLMKSNERMMAE